MTEDKDIMIGVISAGVVFIIAWIACCMAAGFLGFLLGWIPSAILAALLGFLMAIGWRVVLWLLLALFVLVLVIYGRQ